MNLKEKLLELGITEAELSDSLRGFYSTAFFHIYTQGDFNIDLGQINQKDRGTFIHEYVHYWQNVGTLWGLGASILLYETMLKLKDEILAADEIQLPYRIHPTEQMHRASELFRIGMGFSDNRQYENLTIDSNRAIEIISGWKTYGTKRIPTIELGIPFTNGCREKIELGAHIIKESMAALYQSLIDPNAVHADIPYNVVKLLCRHNYPSCYDNTKLLICICHAALFSMQPGDMLISLLAHAQKDSIDSGMALFNEYVNSNTVTTPDETQMPIVAFFDSMVDRFKELLAANLVAPLDYIGTALDLNRLSNSQIPLLAVLYDENGLSIENMNEIVARRGIPYIQINNHGCYRPATTTKKMEELTDQDISNDIPELIVQEAIYQFLTKDLPYHCCPLYNMMCKGSDCAKNECFNTPWLGAQCPFTIVAAQFNLQEKNVHR